MSSISVESATFPWVLTYFHTIFGALNKEKNIPKIAKAMFQLLGLCDYDLEIPHALRHCKVLKEELKTAFQHLIGLYEEKYYQIYTGRYKDAFIIGNQLRHIDSIEANVFYEDQIRAFLACHPMPLQQLKLLYLKGSFSDFKKRFENVKVLEDQEKKHFAFLMKVLNSEAVELSLSQTEKEAFLQFLMSGGAVCAQERGKGKECYLSWSSLILEWASGVEKIKQKRVEALLNYLQIPLSQGRSGLYNGSFHDFLINKSYQQLLRSLHAEALPQCLEGPIKKRFKEDEFFRKMTLLIFCPLYRKKNESKEFMEREPLLQTLDAFAKMVHWFDYQIACPLDIFDHPLSEDEWFSLREVMERMPIVVENQAGSVKALSEFNALIASGHSEEVIRLSKVTEKQDQPNTAILRAKMLVEIHTAVPKITTYLHYRILKTLFFQNPVEGEIIIEEFGKERWHFLGVTLKRHAIVSIGNAIERTKKVISLLNGHEKIHINTFLEPILLHQVDDRILPLLKSYFYQYRFNRSTSNEVGTLLPTLEDNQEATLRLLTQGNNDVISGFHSWCEMIELAFQSKRETAASIPLFFWTELLCDSGKKLAFSDVLENLNGILDNTAIPVPLQEKSYFFYLLLEHLRGKLSRLQMNSLLHLNQMMGAKSLKIDMEIIKQTDDILVLPSQPTKKKLEINLGQVSKFKEEKEEKTPLKVKRGFEYSSKFYTTTPPTGSEFSSEQPSPGIDGDPSFGAPPASTTRRNSVTGRKGSLSIPHHKRSLTYTPDSPSLSSSSVTISLSFTPLNLAEVFHEESQLPPLELEKKVEPLSLSTVALQLEWLDHLLKLPTETHLKLHTTRFLQQIKKVWLNKNLSLQQMTNIIFCYFPLSPVKAGKAVTEQEMELFSQQLEANTNLLSEELALIESLEHLINHPILPHQLYGWLMYAPKMDEASKIVEILTGRCYEIEQGWNLVRTDHKTGITFAAALLRYKIKTMVHFLPLLEPDPRFRKHPYIASFKLHLKQICDQFVEAKCPLMLDLLPNCFKESRRYKLLQGGLENTKDFALFKKTLPKGYAFFNDWTLSKHLQFNFSLINLSSFKAYKTRFKLPFSQNELAEENWMGKLYEGAQSVFMDNEAACHRECLEQETKQVYKDMMSRLSFSQQGPKEIKSKKVKAFLEQLKKVYLYILTRISCRDAADKKFGLLKIDEMTFFREISFAANDMKPAKLNRVITDIVARIRKADVYFKEGFPLNNPHQLEVKSNSEREATSSSTTSDQVVCEFDPSNCNAVTLSYGNATQMVHYDESLIGEPNFADVLRWHIQSMLCEE